ncbi:hypothetical protein [Hydrogenophaga sp. SL48]|uniref:hypothetical protein n=1 Tax=Hydrogenophaga sp. SL48 TaxID=2806347 RepID=UPI001F3C30E2|nr:hypothetical protein [Hydrogenophaga sp. SL48]UJW79624.1 hypothetical protein IM738_17275 [Hydrogenophaga sp. SL48]
MNHMMKKLTFVAVLIGLLSACSSPASGGRCDKPKRADGAQPYDPYCSGEYNK